MEEIKEIGEETKKAIIEEYLKSLLASAPAVNLTAGAARRLRLKTSRKRLRKRRLTLPKNSAQNYKKF